MSHSIDQVKDEYRVLVQGYYSGSDSSSDDGKDDWNFNWKLDPKRFTAEYISIAKALKYITSGSSQDCCVMGLGLLQGYSLDDVTSLSAILEHGGLETMVNLVETNHIPCRVGAMSLLKRLTWNKDIVVQLMNLGLAPLLVKRLGDKVVETRILACDIIADIAVLRSAERAVRKHNGIGRLVSQMKVAQKAILLPASELTEVERYQLKLSSVAAHALWTLSKFKKNRMAMMRAGIIPLMTELILSGKPELTMPMLGVLSNCSSEPLFQLAIENEAIVGILLKDMREHFDLYVKKLCARALANAAGSSDCVRTLIVRDGGMETVLRLLKDVGSEEKDEDEYIQTMLTLLWKTSNCSENMKIFESMEVHKELMKWVDAPDIAVRIPATGAIAEFCKLSSYRSSFINMGVIKPLTESLVVSNIQLVINAAIALGNLGGDTKGAAALRDNDCIRLLWSLLKNRHVEVRKHALMALTPSLQNDPISGEETRRITGALHYIIRELREKDFDLLSSVCAIIAEVGKDFENLAVMSEKGVVQALAKLTTREERWNRSLQASIVVHEELQQSILAPVNRSVFWSGSILSGGDGPDTRYVLPPHYISKDQNINENLRRELSAAIAQCCSLRPNLVEFGRLGVIPQLVKYLTSAFASTRAQAARALWKLSEDLINCIQIHIAGAMPLLLRCAESLDEGEQISAAGCIKNIRVALLKADDIRCVKRKKTSKSFSIPFSMPFSMPL